MAAYSIRDLEVLTGIKAHTIRIWEKRYCIMEPQRTDSNIRYYTDLDLKWLLNISLLYRHGLKISNIACMNIEEINDKIMEFTRNPLNEDSQIDSLIIAMINLNEIQFEEVLSKSTNTIGFEDTVVKILYPFFIKIGILWQINSINPAQEHFVSNIIRQKLIVSIHGLKTNRRKDSKKFILFLPEGELHELGMLFNYYLIKNNGHEVIYLGQSVPFDDLIEVTKIREHHYLLTSITSGLSENELKSYINKISLQFPKKKILVSGPLITKYNFPISRNIVKILSITDFKRVLDKISNN
ncbi:MerR family transcriptional regulator [candidate division KSB1 bacterium]